MANSAIECLPRNTRRQLLSQEEKRRKTGQWGEWERVPVNGTGARKGWGSEVREVRKNSVFAILMRPIGLKGWHLAISSLSGVRPTFHEMQRIKNEIAGDDAFGVEIYPPQGELVDEVDMFHLWICDPLPFGIFEGRNSGGIR